MSKFLVEHISQDDQKNIFEAASKIDLDTGPLWPVSSTTPNSIEQNKQFIRTRDLWNEIETLEVNDPELQDKMKELDQLLGKPIENMVKAGVDFLGAALDPALVNQPSVVVHAVINAYSDDQNECSVYLGNIFTQSLRFEKLHLKGSHYIKAITQVLGENYPQTEIENITLVLRDQVQKQINRAIFEKLNAAIHAIQGSELSSTEKAINTLLVLKFSEQTIKMLGEGFTPPNDVEKFETEFSNVKNQSEETLNKSLQKMHRDLLELTTNSLTANDLENTEGYILDKLLPQLLKLERSGFIDQPESRKIVLESLKNINSSINDSLAELIKNPSDSTLIAHHEALTKFRDAMIGNCELSDDERYTIHLDLLEKTRENSKTLRGRMAETPNTAKLSFRVTLQLATLRLSKDLKQDMQKEFARVDRQEFLESYLDAIRAYLKELRSEATGESSKEKLQERLEQVLAQQNLVFDVLQLAGEMEGNRAALDSYVNEIIGKLTELLGDDKPLADSLESTVAVIDTYVFFNKTIAESPIMKAAREHSKSPFFKELQIAHDSMISATRSFEGQILENMTSNFATSKSFFGAGDTYILSDDFKKNLSILEKLNDEKGPGAYTEPNDLIKLLIQKLKSQFTEILSSKGYFTDISYDQVKDYLGALDLLNGARILTPEEVETITDHIQDNTFKNVNSRLVIMDYFERYRNENKKSRLAFDRLDAYRYATFGEPIEIRLTSLEILGENIDELNQKLMAKALTVFSNLFKPGLTSISLVIDSRVTTETQIRLLKALVATALKNNPLLTVNVDYLQSEEGLTPEEGQKLYTAKDELNTLLNEANKARQKIALKIDSQFDASQSIESFTENCKSLGFKVEELKRLYVGQLLAKEKDITADKIIDRLGKEDQVVFKNLSFLSKNKQNAHIFLKMGTYYKGINADLAVEYFQLISKNSELYPDALLEIMQSASLQLAIAAATQLLSYDSSSQSVDSLPRAQVAIVNLIRMASKCEGLDAVTILTMLVNHLETRGKSVFGNDNIESIKDIIGKHFTSPMTPIQTNLIEKICSSANIDHPLDLIPEDIRRVYTESIASSDDSLSNSDNELLRNQIILLLQFKKPSETIIKRLDLMISQKADISKTVKTIVGSILENKTSLSQDQISLLITLLKNHSSILREEPDLFIKNMASVAENLIEAKEPEAALQVIEHTVNALTPEMKETSLSNNYYLTLKPLRDLLKPFEIASKNRTPESVVQFFRSLIADDEELKKTDQYKTKADTIAKGNVKDLSSRVNRIKEEASNMRSQTGAAKVTKVTDTLAKTAETITGAIKARSPSNSPPSSPKLAATFEDIDEDYVFIDPNDAEAGNSSIANQSEQESEETKEFIEQFGVAAAQNINKAKAVSKSDGTNPAKKDYSDAMKALSELEAALKQLDSLIEDKPNTTKFDTLKANLNFLFKGTEQTTGMKTSTLLGTECHLPSTLNQPDKEAIKGMIRELRASIAQKTLSLKCDAANEGISGLLGYFYRKALKAHDEFVAINAPKIQQDTATNQLFITQTKAINTITLLKNVQSLRKDLKERGDNRDAIIQQYKKSFNEWIHSNLDEAPGRTHSQVSTFGKSIKHATAFFTGKDVKCKQLQKAIEIDSLIALAESDQELDPTIKELEKFINRDIKDFNKNDESQNLKGTFDEALKTFYEMSNQAIKYISRLTSNSNQHVLEGIKNRQIERKNKNKGMSSENT